MNQSGQTARKRLITRLYERGISNTKVLDVMLQIPRHIFIDAKLKHRAYEDNVLPIGYGQTISQPYMVAKMSELLFSTPTLNKVLEIGTGCGYQTAILANLAHKVFSIECIKHLQLQAKDRISKLNLTNIEFIEGNGWQGLSSHAPFDAILVAAAANSVPNKLIEQLAVGGSLIIPLVKEEKRQYLYLIQKTSEQIIFNQIEEVRFVPLVNI